jgi:hypothetical protein
MKQDYLDKWPPIDERLVPLLKELYPITVEDLKGSEWERGFLAGQHDILTKLNTIYETQRSGNSKAQHVRR